MQAVYSNKQTKLKLNHKTMRNIKRIAIWITGFNYMFNSFYNVVNTSASHLHTHQNGRFYVMPYITWYDAICITLENHAFVSVSFFVAVSSQYTTLRASADRKCPKHSEKQAIFLKLIPIRIMFTWGNTRIFLTENVIF